RVLLLDEPTTGVDPVSRREFWNALAHLSADGLTILVATPYLDEAERCHRVALMHKGELRQIGTPAELRRSMGASRLELHTDDVREAERVLSPIAGTNATIMDVQRFGDRLDLLARSPDEGQAQVERTMRGAGKHVAAIRVDEPTLENVFVASLRALGDAPSA